MRVKGGVLCAGAVVYDVVVRPVDEARWGTTTFVESIEFHSGGNAANSSIALGSLGTRVRVLGVLGDDEQARFLEARLAGAGVDTGHMARGSEATAVTIVIVNSEGNRKFLHRHGGADPLFSGPLEFTPERIAGMSHFHLASYFILPGFREHAAETLRRARAAGLVTSFDANWDPRGRWMEDLAPCLPHLDMLFANEDEARMLTGSSDPGAAAETFLGHGVKMAVLKLGARGCAVFTREGELRRPAYHVEVKDTTGAGDCFVAGFLSALVKGESLTDATRLANAMGAFCVQRVGASAGVSGRAEVERWMKGARVSIP